MDANTSLDPAQAARRDRMGLLARAPAVRLAALWGETGLAPDFDWLRAPECGGVMVRGRTGGRGAPFNLGEMTVTRASLRLADGAVGHAYVQGRDKDKARVAALIDALMQGTGADALEAQVLTPLRAEMEASRDRRAAKAAATKVDFFTLVRGED